MSCVAGGVWCVSSWRDITVGIWFQCLSEHDVETLTVEQLAKLRAVFYHTLHTNQIIRDEFHRKISEALHHIREDQGEQEKSDDETSGR
jgi:hypothetical protein